MRLMPVLSAIIVSFALYALVFEREALLAFAQTVPDTAPEETGENEVQAISVVAITSEAQIVDNAVILRGRTEAARQVSVASETSGQVISEPIRKGAFVEAGDLMCQLDPGHAGASARRGPRAADRSRRGHSSGGSHRCRSHRRRARSGDQFERGSVAK